MLRHDLRNNLMAIRNATVYLSRKTEKTELWEEDPRVPQFYGLVEKELVRANETIARFTDMSALFGADVTWVDLGECAGRAVDLARTGPGLRVELDCDESRKVRGSSLELLLMVRCLIDNAAEAMPDGGQVVVRTVDDGTDVVLRVTDSGPGFEDTNRALRQFESDKPGHAGLGLNIARRVASRYGGQLALGDAEGGGAMVEIRFKVEG